MSKAYLLMFCLVLGLVLGSACDDQLDLQACDIREASCQRSIFYAVQRLRGTAWDPWLEMPPMRVISKDQYRAELEASRTEASNYDYFTPALQLVGLNDPDEAADANTDFNVSFIAAYYQAGTRSITVIDRGSDANATTDTTTLAHELVHAAQERDIGFERMSSWITDADSLNAVKSLTEGEAKLYEHLVGLTLQHRSPLSVDWDQYHQKWLLDTRTKIAADPSPWRDASVALRYPLGSSYMTDAWLEGGPLAVRRTLAAHPSSTVRFLAARGSSLDVPRRPLACRRPTAPADHKPVVNTVLGAWGVYALATRLSVTEPDAWQFAQDWVGDHFWVFSTSAKTLIVVWKLRFSSVERAAAFSDALTGLPNNVHVITATNDDTVTLLADPEAAASSWSDWMACGTDD